MAQGSSGRRTQKLPAHNPSDKVTAAATHNGWSRANRIRSSANWVAHKHQPVHPRACSLFSYQANDTTPPPPCQHPRLMPGRKRAFVCCDRPSRTHPSTSNCTGRCKGNNAARGVCARDARCCCHNRAAPGVQAAAGSREGAGAASVRELLLLLSPQPVQLQVVALRQLPQQAAMANTVAIAAAAVAAVTATVTAIAIAASTCHV